MCTTQCFVSTILWHVSVEHCTNTLGCHDHVNTGKASASVDILASSLDAK